MPSRGRASARAPAPPGTQPCRARRRPPRLGRLPATRRARSRLPSCESSEQLGRSLAISAATSSCRSPAATQVLRRRGRTLHRQRAAGGQRQRRVHRRQTAASPPTKSSSTSSNGTGTFKNASGIMSLGDRRRLAAVRHGQDPDVYFYGETIEKLGPSKYRITAAGSPPACSRRRAGSHQPAASIINLDDYAIARNMVLRVKGVPVLYLPVDLLPDQDDERATGFLMPTYGTSTLRGQALSNAFFWAIGRSQDATFFHDWFTRTGQGAAPNTATSPRRVDGQRPRSTASSRTRHVSPTTAQTPPLPGRQQLRGHAATATTRIGAAHPRPRPRRLLLRHRHPAALPPEHLPGHAAAAGRSRAASAAPSAPTLDERALPAQRGPSPTRRRPTCTAARRASPASRRAAAALRHAHLRLAEHRVRLPALPAR